MVSFFRDALQTFYSAAFYQRLIRSGKGVGLGFLTLVTLLNLVHGVWMMAEPFKNFLAEKDAFFAALPALTIKAGVLSMDSPSPVEVKLFEKVEGGPLKIVFDTQVDDSFVEELTPKMAADHVFVMVTKNKILFYDKQKNKTETTELKTLQDAEVTHEKWLEISRTVMSFMLPFMLVLVTIAAFSGHVLTALLGAVFILILSPLFKLDPSLGAGMRLAAAAKVPVATLLMVVSPSLASAFLVWLGFVLFGLLAARRGAPPSLSEAG